MKSVYQKLNKVIASVLVCTLLLGSLLGVASAEGSTELTPLADAFPLMWDSHDGLYDDVMSYIDDMPYVCMWYKSNSYWVIYLSDAPIYISSYYGSTGCVAAPYDSQVRYYYVYYNINTYTTDDAWQARWDVLGYVDDVAYYARRIDGSTSGVQSYGLSNIITLYDTDCVYFNYNMYQPDDTSVLYEANLFTGSDGSEIGMTHYVSACGANDYYVIEWTENMGSYYTGSVNINLVTSYVYDGEVYTFDYQKSYGIQYASGTYQVSVPVRSLLSACVDYGQDIGLPVTVNTVEQLTVSSCMVTFSTQDASINDSWMLSAPLVIYENNGLEYDDGLDDLLGNEDSDVTVDEFDDLWQDHDDLYQGSLLGSGTWVTWDEFYRYQYALEANGHTMKIVTLVNGQVYESVGQQAVDFIILFETGRAQGLSRDTLFALAEFIDDKDAYEYSLIDMFSHSCVVIFDCGTWGETLAPENFESTKIYMLYTPLYYFHFLMNLESLDYIASALEDSNNIALEMRTIQRNMLDVSIREYNLLFDSFNSLIGYARTSDASLSDIRADVSQMLSLINTLQGQYDDDFLAVIDAINGIELSVSADTESFEDLLLPDWLAATKDFVTVYIAPLSLSADEASPELGMFDYITFLFEFYTSKDGSGWLEMSEDGYMSINGDLLAPDSDMYWDYGILE